MRFVSYPWNCHPHHVTGLPPSLSGGPHASVAVVWLAPRTEGGAGEAGAVAAVVASSTELFMPLPACVKCCVFDLIAC